MLTPRPRTLFLAGIVLLGVAVGGALVWRSTRTAAPPQPPVTSPLPAPFGIEGARASGLRPYAATVTWRTNEPSRGSVAWGPGGMAPLLWTAARRPAETHTVTLPGLAPNALYTLRIDARSTGGATSSRWLAVTTGPAPAAPVGTVVNGAVHVNGEPFFPLMTWEECPGQWAPDLADGIDLFAGNPCTNLASLLAAVAGRALGAGTSDDVAETTGPALLGWFYPDEADARGLKGESLGPPPPGLRFLTLTSHFFSGAAPLPTGRAMYPGLLAQADVVGFDLYPLQELCRPDLLPAVFDAQRELARLAPGKATYQWIEEREMKCPQPAAAVTARTIRIESWLAIAGGATGLGFFPPDWQPQVGSVIRSIAARVRQLEPALLQPPAPLATVTASPFVRASARDLNGAYYVIAVNAGRASARAALKAAALGDRSFGVVGSGVDVHADDGTLDVTLPPLSERIYVASPEVS